MKALIKKRQPLLELATSGRHRDHYLWLLTQSYSSIPKNLRRQAKVIFVWYPKERDDLKMIYVDNNVLTNDELVVVSEQLKHACLHIRNENRHQFKLLA